MNLPLLKGGDSSASKPIYYRRASWYSGWLKRNSCPSNTKACSIGVPERRSSQYSSMNSAESWVPASICMACSSAEGASTLSEVRVVGLYQYIFVSSFPKRTLSLMFPLLRVLKHLPRIGGSVGLFLLALFEH